MKYNNNENRSQYQYLNFHKTKEGIIMFLEQEKSNAKQEKRIRY